MKHTSGRSGGIPNWIAAEAEGRGWSVLVCPVEVGCRGFVANSTIRFLKEVLEGVLWYRAETPKDAGVHN